MVPILTYQPLSLDPQLSQIRPPCRVLIHLFLSEVVLLRLPETVPLLHKLGNSNTRVLIAALTPTKLVIKSSCEQTNSAYRVLLRWFLIPPDKGLVPLYIKDMRSLRRTQPTKLLIFHIQDNHPIIAIKNLDAGAPSQEGSQNF